MQFLYLSSQGLRDVIVEQGSYHEMAFLAESELGKVEGGAEIET